MEEKKKADEVSDSLSKFRIASAGGERAATSKVSRDSRLSDIIGKMDLILVQASPKQMATVK